MEHASEKYNMIAMDLRGHGESPLGAEEDFTADALVEDIRHTLQEECIPTPFILIGHRCI
jgi:pimeloyl-ACP methyl ester carboxylesterase